LLLNMPLRVYLQPTKLSDAQGLPTSWLGGSTRGLQPDGHVHKEVVHLLSLQPASITSSGTFNVNVNVNKRANLVTKVTTAAP